ncbi:HPP family protein [Cyclobacterium jeungdonense]|uniref:HPP family protein n=1 Tax=Cyclobacterium jeungdonense TaxID=708087 RepID=A0ABT8C7R1_9BACT|nr:HPP family protein [Cyclobacterium jeungdonense]MDN3688556.1 HPP family protein [Cyclobacterium jeungdonense]
MASKKFKKRLRKARYIIYKETSHNPIDNLWAFFGSLLALSGIGLLQILFSNDENQDFLFLIGAFGATSVLLFGAPNSPLAQPRNMIFGSLISAIIGVTVYRLFDSSDVIWLTPALAVSLSILAMQYTKTLHPPGGAIALIANIGSSEIREMGYFYVINPVLTGVMILFIVALIFNNISKNRIYPYRNVTIRKLGYFQKILYWRPHS